MDTADWAQEAQGFLQEYDQDLLSMFRLETNAMDTLCSKYWKEWDTQQVLTMAQNNPVLKSLDLTNLSEENAFEMFEMVRGWRPVLRRLKTLQDARIVTLARRNLRQPITQTREADNQNGSSTDSHTSNNNLMLVSRQQWALLECLRHAQGLYHNDPLVHKAIQQDCADQADNNSPQTSVSADTVSKFQVKASNGTEGRFVVLQNTDKAVPGEVLHQATPFVTSPYDFAPHHVCFHCAKDFTTSSESGTSFSSVRDLSLQCSSCQVSSLAYCSVACRRAHQARHDRECPYIPILAQKCSELESQEAMEDASKVATMAPFKVLLVLRAALLAKDRPADFAKLLQLESHLEQHRTQQPKYLELATFFSEWISREVLSNDDLEAIACNSQFKEGKALDQCVIDTLVHIFLAIPVNAIGLGSHAVGLFPGISSMLNHSCNENVTHGWESNQTLVFRAVEEISRGEECSISYVTDLHLPTASRTKALADHKFFTCCCNRCLSPDEQGRLETIQEWTRLEKALLAEDEEAKKLALYRQRVELAQSLFPTYFVTKGLVMEELAHALLDAHEPVEDEQVSQEVVQWLNKAKDQYQTCRGARSNFVTRVDQVLHMISEERQGVDNKLGTHASCDAVEEEVIDADADLILDEGWQPLVLEVKLFEALDDVAMRCLANKIKAETNSIDIHWAEDHRTYEIGYGIRSLILACQLNHSVNDKNHLIDLLEEKFDDDIQHVDILTNTIE